MAPTHTARREAAIRCTWLLLGVLVVGACTGGDDDGATTTAPVLTSERTTAATGAPATAPGERGEPELPVLDDVEAPPWEPSTRTEELLLAISDAEAPTPQQAVDAFGLLVDEMPGATPSDLPPGDGLGDSYTLRLIESVRDRLTPAQVTVLDEYLDPGTLVGTITADGSIEVADGSIDTTPPSTSTATSVEPEGLRRVHRSPEVPLDLDYLELLDEVQDAWAEHLPGHPTHEIELRITPDPYGGMDATLKPDDPGTCLIRVHAGFFQGNPSDDEIRFFFAHELFHCMQFAWQSALAPPWVDEGSADWAAADLFRKRTLDYDELTPKWFTRADAPLATRSYSAWPFFENARLHGRNVYELIEAMYESELSVVTPILAAVQLDGVVFRKDWSTRALRSSPLSALWDLPWPSPDPDFGPHDNLFSRGPRGLGIYNINGAGRFTHVQYAVQMTPEVGLVTVTPSGGPLTTPTAVGTQTVGDGATRTFCFVLDGCVCPEGSTSGAVPMDSPEMIFSFAASFGGTIAAVRAEEWDPERSCHEEPDPHTASSNGDPHLLSFDGLPFDVVTLGEFVVARDPEGGFEVQTRHAPFGFGAGTTGVALGTGSDRIMFTMPEFFSADQPVVRVNGEPTTEDDVTVGDVRVEIDGTDALATWPDGSTVELHWFLGWFVQLTVAPERAARMEGLLGSADGDLGNDLRLPDGAVVDTTDAALPESPYALAWAVDADTTLFDYEPGQSVRTFRIPHPNPEPPEIDAAAHTRCTDALGDLAAAHEISSCAYDVSATGEDGFVEEYVTIVDERVRGMDVVMPPGPTSAPTTTRGPAAESQSGVPTLTLSGERPEGTVDVVEGTVLLARTAACDPSADTREVGYLDVYVYRVDDVDQRAIAALCDPSGRGGLGADADDEWFEGEGYVWLPGSGEYLVVLDQILGDRDAVGNVEIFVDPSPTVLRSTDVVAGDRRELEGIGDTVVYLGEGGSFDAVGLGEACAVEVYWGRDEFPDDQPRDLNICTHATAIKLPPNLLIPVVVFNRTPTRVTVELTPSE